MRTFADTQGNAWIVSLNLTAAERIDKADFTAIYDKPVCFLNSSKINPEFFDDLYTNTSLAMFLVWCIIHPQAVERGVTEEDFKDLLGPQSINQARKILWEEIDDFFPDLKTSLSRRRSLMGKIQAKIEELTMETETVVVPHMDRIVREAMAELENELAEQSVKTGEAST